jgi:O-antigen/teichoic acid export membrane protein
MALAQAYGNVLVVSVTDIAMAVFPFLVTIAAAVAFDPTVTILVGAWTAGALVTAVVQFVVAFGRGSYRIARARKAASSIMRRSVRVALANGTALLCARIDVLVVAAVISASAAGIYSIPVALAANLLLLSRSLLTATYRSIMVAPENEVAERLGTAVRHSVIIVLAGGALSIPVVAAASGFVFGDAYSDIWKPYTLLVLASACICVVEVLRHYLLTRVERQNEFVLVVTAMLIVNGVLAAAGAALFGLVGAAASTTITYALAAFALVRICARSVGVPMRDLAVPRVSDLKSYWRAARSLAGRLRSTPAIAPK